MVIYLFSSNKAIGFLSDFCYLNLICKGKDLYFTEDHSHKEPHLSIPGNNNLPHTDTT
jgi:hypothetical protein